MTRVKAVILDIDGTLIDSNDAHAAAWVDMGREFGFEIPFVEARPLIGMGGDRVLPMLTGVREESDEGQRMSERRGEIFRSRYLPELRPFDGARPLLERMRDEGLRLVVATSSNEKDMRALLERAGVDDLIEDATSSSDAEESKPDPDIVRAALKKTGQPASGTLMIGDTPYDVAACRRARVPIVAVRCGGWWADDAFEGANAVYDGPAALLSAWSDSPLGR